MPLSKIQFGNTGRRNLIINGAMQVWQRGTSVDSIATGGYQCDRWRIAHAGLDGNVDIDQDTSVPTGQGFPYSMKVSMDASESSLDAGDQVNVTHRFEAQNLQHLGFGTSSAKSLVVSFWVKSSVAGTYSLEWQTQDSPLRMIGRTYTINSANTWEYKTLTIPGDPSATINNDNGGGLDLRWWIDAGTDWYGGTFATNWENRIKANRVNNTTGWLESTSPTWHITGVQMETGTAATDFEHRSFGEELALCQRYFIRVPEIDASSAYAFLATGMATDVNAVDIPIPFPVTMRANPTLVTSGSIRVYNGGTVNPASAITLYSGSTSVSCLRVNTGSVLSTKDAILIGLNNDVDANFQFSAEL